MYMDEPLSFSTVRAQYKKVRLVCKQHFKSKVLEVSKITLRSKPIQIGTCYKPSPVLEWEWTVVRFLNSIQQKP